VACLAQQPAPRSSLLLALIAAAAPQCLPLPPLKKNPAAAGSKMG